MFPSVSTCFIPPPASLVGKPGFRRGSWSSDEDAGVQTGKPGFRRGEAGFRRGSWGSDGEAVVQTEGSRGSDGEAGVQTGKPGFRRGKPGSDGEAGVQTGKPGVQTWSDCPYGGGGGTGRGETLGNTRTPGHKVLCSSDVV